MSAPDERRHEPERRASTSRTRRWCARAARRRRSSSSARDREQAELDHRAGEEHADRRRRDGVRVGEPEVERHDRRLHQEADEEQRERDDDEAVGAGPSSVPPDLREVERARARVEERDPDQDQVRADACSTIAKLIAPCSGPSSSTLKPASAYAGDAHQLEPDEHVEEVAREREAAHAPQKTSMSTSK